MYLRGLAIFEDFPSPDNANVTASPVYDWSTPSAPEYDYSTYTEGLMQPGGWDTGVSPMSAAPYSVDTSTPVLRTPSMTTPPTAPQAAGTANDWIGLIKTAFTTYGSVQNAQEKTQQVQTTAQAAYQRYPTLAPSYSPFPGTYGAGSVGPTGLSTTTLITGGLLLAAAFVALRR